MADKDKKLQLRDPETGKYLGKYDSEEDAVKGIREMEQKYGDQGREYGSTKKQMEQLQAEMSKYQKWYEQAQPIVNWYGQNQQPLTEWWSNYQKRGQQGQGQQYGNGNMNYQQQQQMGQQAYNQASNMVNSDPNLQFLTPQERQALTQQTAQQIIEQTLGPWTQKFATTVEGWAQKQMGDMRQQMEQRHKAMSDVFWRTYERTLPPDKLAEVKKWHDEALKLADPKNVDPMALASEKLQWMNDRDRMQKELDEHKSARDRAEKQAMGSLGDSGGMFGRHAEVKEAPKNREERFKNVMGDMKEQVGIDGIRDTFASL